MFVAHNSVNTVRSVDSRGTTVPQGMKLIS